MNLKKTWKRFWTLSKSREGFTLVELIVVIAIMAILAGVAVPAYSGYINKANKAADLQLLGAINTAFGAAVMDVDGISPTQVTDAVAFDINNMTVTGKYQTAFQLYYGGNTGKFKAIEALYFNKAEGVFSELPGAYAGLVGAFNSDDTTAVYNSTFNQMGVASLLGQVDMLSNTVATGGYLDNGTLSDIVYSEEYGNNLAATLGISVDELNEKLGSMDETARNEYLANSVVLSVAQTATGMNTTDVTNLLTSGSVQTSISNALDTDPQTGLAQAALAYGMFTAYANSSEYGSPELQEKANNISNVTDLTSILTDMNSTEFQNYVNSTQGQNDLNGYMGAMNMINDAADDKTAAESVLTNGFDDSALAGLIQSAIG